MNAAKLTWANKQVLTCMHRIKQHQVVLFLITVITNIFDIIIVTKGQKVTVSKTEKKFSEKL